MSLHINKVSFAYSTFPVMKEVSLTVPTGEFVSLIGPSGCGKSTLFKIIGGLLSPDNGEILLEGETITGQRGHIAYMPQQYSLLPWYTVEENIRLASTMKGEKSSVPVGEWLKKTQLEGVAQAYPYELSGGMQQRVAFIRALATQKSFLCLDEPFSALDALTRTNMYEWMISLQEVEKRTILFITHSVEEAMLLSDRIYLLSPQPMRVIAEQRISFPRVERSQLRGDPEWFKLQGEIEAILRNEKSLPPTCDRD